VSPAGPQDSFFRGGCGCHCLSGQIRTSSVSGVAERPAAPIDERSPHAGRFRTDAIEGVVRDEEDLIRLETEKLGRESKRPDAASAAFTAVLVSLGQTAQAVLSADNESVRVSDMVLIIRWDACA
jgi:hypothetical protein